MSTMVQRVRFPAAGDLDVDLKRRVEDYFARTGLPPRGGRAMHVKTAVMFCWFGASYGLLLAYGGASGWIAVLLTLSLALAMARIGFSVMHDANHGSYSNSPRVNRTMGLALDLIGGSSYFWRFKHNVYHHTYANIAGMDADIEAPFMRMAPWQARHWVQRYQHIYIWLLYGLLPIGWWFVDDFNAFFGHSIIKHPYPRPRGWELAGLLGGKAIFFSWAIVIPALLHPTWWLVPLFLLGAFTLGVTLSSVFQLAHCVGEAAFHLPRSRDQQMETGWAEHQVLSTVDFAPHARLLSWYVGGLNYQVEHHLFPKVCHIHYPAMSALVRESCREHGVHYQVQPTLGSAIVANLRWLRELGRAPLVEQAGTVSQ